ncbi:MAG: hypothetical protein RL491_1188, partial [Bacteroidota bacterium]
NQEEIINVAHFWNKKTRVLQVTIADQIISFGGVAPR